MVDTRPLDYRATRRSVGTHGEDADARVAASGELAARAAHLHHQQGRTNIEIAEELGISRLGIPALLRQAEAEGTVSYLINPPAGMDADRSDRVREKYSLAEALIPTSTLPTAAATYENCWSAAPWSVFPGVS